VLCKYAADCHAYLELLQKRIGEGKPVNADVLERLGIDAELIKREKEASYGKGKEIFNRGTSENLQRQGQQIRLHSPQQTHNGSVGITKGAEQPVTIEVTDKIGRRTPQSKS
jgi:hypothetical protein